MGSLLLRPVETCRFLFSSWTLTRILQVAQALGPFLLQTPIFTLRPVSESGAAAHFNSKVRQGTWSMKPHNFFFFFLSVLFCDFYLLGIGLSSSKCTGGVGGKQDKFQGKIPWQHGFSPAQNISGSICDKGKADLHQKGQKLEAFNKCKPHLVCKWNKQLHSVSGFISKLLQGMQHFARAFPRWWLRFVHRLFKWGSEAYKTEPTSNTKSLLAHANVKWLEPSKTSPSVLKVRLPFMF